MSICKLQLTKLECAKRQLETAIKIYARFGDPVSIHTLASAAYSLLQNINTFRGGTPMMKDLHVIKPEYKKMIRDKLNKHQNYFKHADNDPTGSIEFDPKITEGVLFEACAKHFEFTNERTPYLQVFMTWFQLQNPLIFKNKDKDKLALET